METKKIKKTENKQEYFKNYYMEHPEKFKKYDPNDIITCPCCASTIKKNGWSHHIKTKKHELLYIRYYNEHKDWDDINN